jgi:hypothetical protein
MTPQAKLRQGIAGGLIAIVAIMPFHAFLSVWLGTLTGHEAIIEAWKEALLVLLALAAAYLALREPQSRDRLRSLPILLVALFIVVGFIVTAFTRPSFTAIAFGAKTDMEFLLAFVIAVLVATPRLVKRLTGVILATSAIVICFAVLQSTVLAPNFLSHFGYSKSTIVPYQTLDAGVSSLRFASTLGGPNQLGTFLILPMALAGVLSIRRRKYWLLVLDIAGGYALIHTYSRGAWLGALGAAIVVSIVSVSPRLRAKVAAGFGIAIVIASLTAAELVRKGSHLQYYIFHGENLFQSGGGSDYQHIQSLRTGLTDSLTDPVGHGLGSAGPAVFHSGTGIIIENNYLQISYETGWAGLAVFLALIASVGLELGRRSGRHDLAAAALAALVGISITALTLPAWTDSSTALIFWIASGAVIGLTPNTSHV